MSDVEHTLVDVDLTFEFATQPTSDSSPSGHLSTHMNAEASVRLAK